jgi:hypothetical protein
MVVGGDCQNIVLYIRYQEMILEEGKGEGMEFE